MKLTKEQERVIREAKEQIDEARGMTFVEWYNKHFTWHETLTEEEVNARIAKTAYDREWYEAQYESEKSGVVTSRCNSRTIEALERMGLIEIVHNGKDFNSRIDTIKLLNY